MAIAFPSGVFSSLKRSLPGHELEMVEQILHVHQADNMIDVLVAQRQRV